MESRRRHLCDRVQSAEADGGQHEGTSTEGFWRQGGGVSAALSRRYGRARSAFGDRLRQRRFHFVLDLGMDGVARPDGQAADFSIPVRSGFSVGWERAGAGRVSLYGDPICVRATRFEGATRRPRGERTDAEILVELCAQRRSEWAGVAEVAGVFGGGGM